METPKAPNYRRLAIIGVLFIIVSFVLLFWARDVIRELIVLPLSYIFFVIGVLIDFTPQVFFWIVVLLIAVRVAYGSVSQKKKKDEAAAGMYFRPIEDRPITSGRVTFWTNKVQLLRSGRGVYYTSTFHEALSKTLLQLLAYRYRMTALQVEEGLKDGSLNLPPEIRQYALDSLDSEEGTKGNYWNWLWVWISSALQNGFFRLKFATQKMAGGANALNAETEGSNAQAHSEDAGPRLDPRRTGVDARVRRVLKFMEEELEVPHDDTGR